MIEIRMTNCGEKLVTMKLSSKYIGLFYIELKNKKIHVYIHYEQDKKYLVSSFNIIYVLSIKVSTVFVKKTKKLIF
ncbi:hypothetical protein FKM82_018772 [Ascaphus truei]